MIRFLQDLVGTGADKKRSAGPGSVHSAKFSGFDALFEPLMLPQVPFVDFDQRGLVWDR
jgi:hypothetical protein